MIDLTAPGAKILAGQGSGASSDDPFIQQTQQAPSIGADGSGTITSGGSAQQLFGAAIPANGYMVQNTSDGELWLSDIGAASVGGTSFRLAPGQLFCTPPGYAPLHQVSLFGATTGQSFAARRW